MSVSRVVSLLLFMVALLAIPAAADVQYFYDELGRLVQVTDLSGNAAQYNYDPAGNITGIKQVASATLSIAEFSPNAGAIGATVTIYGTGFNTTAASNTVKFNGTTATVTAATANQLTTTVPTGATTGTISVANGTSTVSSGSTFTVIAATAPSITSFTPTKGAAGTAVSITGKNFDPSAANDKVRFNGVEAVVTSATAIQVSSTVPNATSSGKITVATSYGTATSATDFFVPPSGYTVADIGKTARTTVGNTALTFNTTTAGKIGLLVFDGAIGQNLGIGISAVGPAGASGRIYIKKPNGQDLMGSVLFDSAGISIHLPTLPVTGTYTLVVVPPSAAATVNFVFTLSADIASTLPVNGAVTLASTRIGQSGRYTFTGTAGQHLGLGLNGVTFSPTGGNGTLFIKNPNGQDLIAPLWFYTNDFPPTLPALPMDGLYTVLVTPNTASAVNATLSLSQDFSASLTVDGPATPFSSTRAGQNGRYTFSGQAGQGYSLALPNMVTSPAGGSVNITLLKSDGTVLNNSYYCTAFSATSGTCDISPLPANGTYTIVLDPAGIITTTFDIWLTRNVNAGVLPMNGTAVTYNTTKPGQNGYYTFSGTAGQNLSVVFSGNTIPSGTLYIWKVDGTAVASRFFNGTVSGSLDIPPLPANDNYMLMIFVDGVSTGSINLTLKTNASGTITVDGPAVPINLAAGQNGEYYFAATANQKLGIGIGPFVTTPAGGVMNVYVDNPDGSHFVDCNAYTSAGVCNVPALPASGTYRLWFDNRGAESISFTATLSSEKVGTLTVDAATNISLSRVGQNARYTFNGQVNQGYGVALTNITTTPAGGSIGITLQKSDGSVLNNVYSCGGFTATSGNCDINPLPATDTYTVILRPSTAATFTAWLTKNVNGGILPISGAPISYNTSEPGQNARYTFNGTQGQNLRLAFTNNTISTGTIYVNRADGSVLNSMSYSGMTNGGLDIPTLTATDTYTVIVFVDGVSTGRIDLQVQTR
ncbi:MAG: IPT/TIG domain-containing protein [Pseudomonadota bacterium]